MKKFWKQLCAVMLVLVAPLVPVAASASTITVSQVITITATVLPARSIVVNEQGQMTKIYSNTSENVTPKVYVNSAPSGKELSITPELQYQYDSIMAKPGNKAGVEIPVAIPIAQKVTGPLHDLLSVGSSVVARASFLRF